MSRGTCSIEDCGKRVKARGLCDMHDYRWRVHGNTHTTNRGTPAERFWKKVQKGPDCWLWTAAQDSGGYGKFSETDKGAATYKAHRYAYELLVGSITPGMDLDHRCHVRLCVNPTHLRPVTTKQNGENRRGAASNSTTGVRGVSITKRGLYKVAAGHHGKYFYGGQFHTLTEAAEAAKQLRLSLFSHNDVDRKSA